MMSDEELFQRTTAAARNYAKTLYGRILAKQVQPDDVIGAFITGIAFAAMALEDPADGITRQRLEAVADLMARSLGMVQAPISTVKSS